MARPATGGARARQARPRRGGGTLARHSLLLLLGSLGVVTLAAWLAMPATSAPPPASSAAPAAVGPPGAGSAGSQAPSAPTTAGPSPSADPSSPTPTPTRRAAPSATPAQTTAPPAGRPAPDGQHDGAPGSAAEFRRAGQVIQIGFPLKAATRYHYRDNWGDLRVGRAEHYNHAHSRRGRELRRAHDGIDIYARRGEPVLAPFDGVVVRPAQLWQPWHRERYGRTAVIVSREPTSAGYIALLSHLDRLWVQAGQEVSRGEIVGTVGSTGNAEGGPPHLHFELRAPFTLTWRQAGMERQVDAFNPYPSLIAADPSRPD